ncbi:MAG TPA: hypothetical protein DCL21_02985 [Alphaproteobacteria bacterium]|nr:hypothetical protein [Alphaproteobacteria bacterium]
MLKKIKKMYPHQSLMMIFILGLMIIAGSFTVEHIFKVQPCDMCLWQRYLTIAITIVAFIGTLFRGKIKKLFLATISIVAAVSLSIGLWQSLAQHGLVDLPSLCAAPEQAEVTTTAAEATAESAALLANLESNTTDYVDCSKPEAGFFFYDLTGITLANINVVIMLFISVFSFYKLFFKPRKRFRKYNRRNNNNNNRNNHNRRYRGSGYHRSNNRNSGRRYHNNNNRRNDQNN